MSNDGVEGKEGSAHVVRAMMFDRHGRLTRMLNSGDTVVMCVVDFGNNDNEGCMNGLDGTKVERHEGDNDDRIVMLRPVQNFSSA